MKLKHIAIATTLSAALVLQGCATMNIPGLSPSGSTASSDTAAKPASKTGGILKGAGIGCLAGGGLSFLLGKKNTKSLAMGCVVGGATGGFIAYEMQLHAAKDAAAAAQAAGMKAKVETKTVTAEDGKQTEALQSLVIAYDPSDMKHIGPKTRDTLDKLGGLTKAAKNKLDIRFEGKSPACEVPLKDLERQGALMNHTVIDRCGATTQNRIVISPMPEV